MKRKYSQFTPTLVSNKICRDFACIEATSSSLSLRETPVPSVSDLILYTFIWYLNTII